MKKILIGFILFIVSGFVIMNYMDSMGFLDTVNMFYDVNELNGFLNVCDSVIEKEMPNGTINGFHVSCKIDGKTYTVKALEFETIDYARKYYSMLNKSTLDSKKERTSMGRFTLFNVHRMGFYMRNVYEIYGPYKRYIKLINTWNEYVTIDAILENNRGK